MCTQFWRRYIGQPVPGLHCRHQVLDNKVRCRKALHVGKSWFSKLFSSNYYARQGVSRDRWCLKPRVVVVEHRGLCSLCARHWAASQGISNREYTAPQNRHTPSPRPAGSTPKDRARPSRRADRDAHQRAQRNLRDASRLDRSRSSNEYDQSKSADAIRARALAKANSQRAREPHLHGSSPRQVPQVAPPQRDYQLRSGSQDIDARSFHSDLIPAPLRLTQKQMYVPQRQSTFATIEAAAATHPNVMSRLRAVPPRKPVARERTRG